MSKLQEILATGKAPGFNGKTLDDRDVDRATPRALKSLTTRDENKLIKESGFSANHIKRTWGLLVLLGLWFPTWELIGQDINPGYVFTATDRVTATKLNNLVNIATINPTFISGKSASSPQGADNFIFYRGGVLYRTPFANMGVNSTNLITDQTQDFVPDPDDLLLTYKITAGAYRKTTLKSLVLTNDNLIMTRSAEAAPSENNFFILGQDSTTGDFKKITRSNYFYNCFNFVQWSNLAHFSPGLPTPITFPIFDYASGTNYQASFDELIGLAPVYTTNDASGYVVIMTNGLIARMTMFSLSNNIVAGIRPLKFTSSDTAVPAGGNNVINTAHGLPGAPQMVRAVLVCQTGEAGYSAGDEADINSVGNLSYAGLAWNVGANSANVWVTYKDTSGAGGSVINAKTTGAGTAWTPANWKVRLYAVYFP